MESATTREARARAGRGGDPALGQGDLAPSKKNASRLKASLIFLDESGFLTSPFVRRTWAPRGRTPVLIQNGHRDKVSVVAVLSVSPKRRRVGLYFSLYPNKNINGEVMIDFLRDLRRHIRNPMVLVWDRSLTHRARGVGEFLHGTKGYHPVLLPPYAPELNPVELVWAYLKTNPLANLGALDVWDLLSATNRHARRLQRREDLLRSLIGSGPLFLRLT
jgi:putative transposase